MGMLILCPTPIGNLKDMTERAKQALMEADLIAAEDTRNTAKLLSLYGIDRPLLSYHQHNEQSRSEEIIRRIQEGQTIVLVTDAGMPAISDPGQILVQKCRKAGVAVTCLPGPCAFVTALALSGLDSRRFIFEGFLPTDKKERKTVLSELSGAHHTTIFYEAPHRLKKTLAELCPVVKNRQMAVVRELTKVHEECRIGTVNEHLAYYEENEPKGEFVLVIEGKDPEEIQKENIARFEDMTIREHMALYADLAEKDAMKQVAKDRGVSKREIYQALLSEETGKQQDVEE